MECDGEEYWVKFLGEVSTTQILDQLADWSTNPSSGKEVPKINWIISVFPSTKKNNGSPEPSIK